MSNWLKSILKPEKHVRFNSNVGSRFKTLYSPKVSSKGSIDLVESGKDSIYEYIQSFKDSCDINVLLKRFRAGDTAALMSGHTEFLDTIEMPKTYAEMLQVSIDYENFFNKLPSDVKKKFDNNFGQFVATIGSDEWMSSLGIEKKVDSHIIDEVKEGVNSES